MTDCQSRFRGVLGSLAALAAVGAASAQLQPQLGPPVRVDAGGTAAAHETTASAAASNPDEIVMGWNDWRRSGAGEVINAGFAWTLDGGLTWTDALIRPPAPNQSGVEGDPMTAFDERTGYLFAGAISFGAGGNSGIYVARKAPGAAAFEPAVMARTAAGTDKCWMASGPIPGNPDVSRLYVTYNEGVIRSDDLGLTWTPPASLGSGVGFLPRIGPAGELYVSTWNFGDQHLLVRSLDGGQTFQTRVIADRMDVWGVQDGSRAPGNFRKPALAGLAVSPVDGSLAFVWFDTTQVIGGQFDLDLYFTRSTDGGDTWSEPRVILDDPPGATVADQIFPWLEYDADGRLHLLWMDTRRNVGRDEELTAFYDAYYGWSIDDGATWRAYPLSPAPFDCADDGLDRAQQFVGDYLGMAVSDRAVYPSYFDTSSGDPDIFTRRIDLPVPGDVDGDDTVNFADLVAVLANWGDCPGPDPCPADVDGDGSIGLDDLLFVLARFGS
jgi:hypothetical protein